MMKFKIPFEGTNVDRLKKVSKPYYKKIRYKPDSKLSMYLKNSGAPLKSDEYLGICRRSFLNSFFALLFLFFVLLFVLGRERFYFLAIGVSLLISGIAYMNQRAYPRIYFLKRQRDIEKNLIPALEDVLIQLSSGIPLFSILVNVSDSNYGELSVEFEKAVQKINAGEAEVDVLEELGENNPSSYFKRVLWQLSNGMRAGSDMMVVIQDNLHSLNEEQMIQIQEYGNKLNPLIMFYMLISVIAPALSVTFMTILSSMISLPKNMTIMAFMGLFVFVVLVQIMFLGIIKSKRPSLM